MYFIFLDPPHILTISDVQNDVNYFDLFEIYATTQSAPLHKCIASNRLEQFFLKYIERVFAGKHMKKSHSHNTCFSIFGDISVGLSDAMS